MEFSESLKKNRDFQNVYKKGKSLFFFKDSENSILLSFFLPNAKKREEKATKAAAYADNFFLPFALLAASTFLPPAVFILALNP